MIRWKGMGRGWQTTKNSRSHPALYRPADGQTMLVSFPRSGNTWVRFVLAALRAREPSAITYANLDRFIPDLYQIPLRRLRRWKPEVVKSHEPFSPAYGRVIYLVRDPRDVLLSYHRYWQKVGQNPEPLEAFGRWFVFGGDRPRFGTWGEHVGSWLGARRTEEDFLLLSYERMVAHPRAVISVLADFLGWSAGTHRLDRIVELTSADRLRVMESDPRNVPPYLRKGNGIPMVGPATPGRWREELPPETAELVARGWAPLMEDLGYGLG